MIFKKPYAYARGLQGSGTTATEMFPKLKDQSMQQSSSRELIQGSLFYFIFFIFLGIKKDTKIWRVLARAMNPLSSLLIKCN